MVRRINYSRRSGATWIVQELNHHVLCVSRLLLHRLVGQEIGLVLNIPWLKVRRCLLLSLVALAEMVDYFLS